MRPMVVLRRGPAGPAFTPWAALVALVAAFAVIVPAVPARAAEPGMCRVINVDFTPGGIAEGTQGPAIAPQIVAWLETASGEYVQTIYITQKTGRYGLGNRPGRFDFNSGPGWPYGRRTTVFPVWSNKHGIMFPQVDFRSGGDNNLSHQFGESSPESFYCRPLERTDPLWDSATCASSVYTDKGIFGTASSGYPPRSDVSRAAQDSPSVDMYKRMNQFDAVSQATPRIGEAALISWPIPADLAMGDYVLYMEVALEQDTNDAYNPSRPGMGPPAGIPYGDYGVPYRGQPSIVYRVPFIVASTETFATSDDYVGYGDPHGLDGLIRTPDATITTGVANTGSSRLLMTSKEGQTFRLRVNAHPEQDFVAPGEPGEMVVTTAETREATLSFRAPGDDGFMGVVRGYEVRYVVGDGIVDEVAFAAANEMPFTADIAVAGSEQQITVRNLLPETEYTVAVRAYDDCHNTSKITTTTFTTAPRRIGEVDACFVATAAYGSVMAGDVEMLRRFRDNLLKRSVLGELAVEAYYTFGPSVAGMVGESDLLRATARDVLGPIVAWARGQRR
jgi:hypothetical protein